MDRSSAEAPEPGWLSGLGRATGALNLIAVRLSGVLILFIVGAIVYDVFNRYVLNSPTTWAIDFASFALVQIFFLGLSPALESGHHVTVDLANQFVGRRTSRILAVLASLLTIVFGAVLFWQVARLTSRYFSYDQLSLTVIPVKLKYVFAVAPIGLVLFLLTALVQLGRSIISAASRNGAVTSSTRDP